MRRVLIPLLAVVAALAAAVPVPADDFMYEKIYYVRVGDPAPEFQCRDETGKLWRSKDLIGRKKIVLVFYLGDFFPDCAKRLNAYRDCQKALSGLGAEVLAISGDVPENHELFRKTNRLNFPMLADTEAAVAKEYGVYASSGGFTKIKDADGKVSIYKRAATLANWTFVIGLDGKVIYKDMNADPTADSRKVYELLYRLNSARR
jgi:peroxiredoxin Q/BCP